MIKNEQGISIERYRPEMSNIYLVRHGESAGNVLDDEFKIGHYAKVFEAYSKGEDFDWPLTERGVQEANLAGKYLRTHVVTGFEKIICSPYIRTQQTLHHLDVGVGVIEPLVCEQNLGIYSDQRGREEVANHLAFNNAFPTDASIRPPDGEAACEVYSRLQQFWTTTLPQTQGKNTLIISHWLPIFFTRFLFEDIPLECFSEAYCVGRHILNCQIDHYTDISPINGCLSPRISWRRSILPGLEPSQWQSV